MNGDNGIRTRGLYVANVALSQLSYVPMLTTARFSLHKIPCRFSRQRKWRQQGSNLRPHACDACALPAELCLRQLFYHIFQKLQLFFCFIFKFYSKYSLYSTSMAYFIRVMLIYKCFFNASSKPISSFCSNSLNNPLCSWMIRVKSVSVTKSSIRKRV